MPPAWIDSLREVPEIGDAPFAALAAVISGPPLAPYGLIRQARRSVFGAGTLYLEAMLCDSELVEAVSKDGVELVQDFRIAAQNSLREGVLAERIPVDELWTAVHCEHFEMSPLLYLEEQLVWAFVSQPDPGPECDRLLSACLLSIVRENRHQILDWAAGALRRLPDLVASTPSAWLLSELCNALYRQTRTVKPPSLERIQRLEPGLLREVLPLLPTAMVGFHRDGTTLSLGPISRVRRTAFTVPGIALRPVTVTWNEAPAEAGSGVEDDGSGAGSGSGSGPGIDVEPADVGRQLRRELTVDVTHQVDLIPVGGAEVRLRTVAGAIITLPPFGSGTKAPELVDLDESLDRLEDAWRNARSVTAVVLRAVSAYGAIVRFVDTRAVSGYLRLERTYVEETGITPWNMVGRNVAVRISNFDRSWQRILCRLAPEPTWTPGILTPGMEVRARFETAIHAGFLVTIPTTEQGFEGPTVKGLVHTSKMPKWWRPENTEPGQLLRVTVLHIDMDKQQVSLAAVDDFEELLTAFPQGTVVTGRVSKVVPFGVFVELLPGFASLLHNSEIPEGPEFEVDDEVRVQIIGVDLGKTRFSLGTVPRLPSGAPTRQLTLKPTGTGPAGAGGPNGAKKAPGPPPAPPPPPPRPRPKPGYPNPDDVAAFLRQYLRQLSEPQSLVVLAKVLRDRFGPKIGESWIGYNGLKRMLLALVPEATTDTVQPGHVHPLKW